MSERTVEDIRNELTAERQPRDECRDTGDRKPEIREQEVRPLAEAHNVGPARDPSLVLLTWVHRGQILIFDGAVERSKIKI